MENQKEVILFVNAYIRAKSGDVMVKFDTTNGMIESTIHDKFLGKAEDITAENISAYADSYVDYLKKVFGNPNIKLVSVSKTFKLTF